MAKGQKKQKGGRTEFLRIRLTPAEKKMILELAAALFHDKNPEKCRTDAIIFAVKSTMQTIQQ